MASRKKSRVSGALPQLSPKQADVAAIVQGLRRIVRALYNHSQEVRAAYGLTAAQLWALRELLKRGRMQMGQLAEALMVHQSSVSLLIGRLERRGLVRRVASGADRRVVTVELTRKGEILVSDAPEAAHGRMMHGLDAISPTEVRKLREAVDRLVDTMEVKDVRARFFFSDV